VRGCVLLIVISLTLGTVIVLSFWPLSLLIGAVLIALAMLAAALWEPGADE
jgi:hypothetical protein